MTDNNPQFSTFNFGNVNTAGSAPVSVLGASGGVGGTTTTIHPLHIRAKNGDVVLFQVVSGLPILGYYYGLQINGGVTYVEIRQPIHAVIQPTQSGINVAIVPYGIETMFDSGIETRHYRVEHILQAEKADEKLVKQYRAAMAGLVI